MKTIEIPIPNLEALEEAAYKFMTEMGDLTVYAFYGEMGAGKTTFINALCKQLGVETDVTNSPSFAIMEEEAVDLGAEDYFDSGALCFIEWPERIDGLLPDDTVRVDITVNDDESRTLKMTFPTA